ncbi:helix-turn-helix domain-containing protein [Velocimicrobium porci]|uniref:Helix-turn-helix transcriptional regulator n=1 Tax=Velocimicrobium porci TaxID=2606634 RepID=A0A6L5Y0A7_9FIRM|nr:helix-turn-helix transcriptional regulator [Velocimicrobium porci]MSS64566.1 helix-turn-helix transcriptional regulator [Velocimicrobium porci]
MNDTNNIIERIKKLRSKEFFNLNQNEFANRIGISRSNLANIETGKVKLTDRVAKDICKEFKINYLWLMEGEGEPIKEISIEIFDEIKKAYDLSNDDVTILKEYSSLDKNHRERLKNYIKALIYVEKKEEG